MKPKTCSIRLRIVEICLLLFFCLAVSGAPFLPFSQIKGGQTGIEQLVLNLLALVAGICEKHHRFSALLSPRQVLLHHLGVGVMNFGRAWKNLDNELAHGAHQKASLVAVAHLLAFLGPAGVNILVARLVRMIVPQRGAFAFFDEGIFFTCIALLGCLHKARVGNHSLGTHFGVDRLKLVNVVGKDFFKHFRLSEDLLVFPNRLVARNVARIVDSKPVLKHVVLQHLLLKILVGFTEQSLCNNAFEHENRVHRSPPGSTKFLVGFASARNTVGVYGFCELRSVVKRSC